MASRHPPPRWFEFKLTIGALLNFLGLFAFIVTFYATTSYRLAEYDKRFEVQERAIEVAKSKAMEIGKTDLTERDKSRAEFLARAEKTADGIGELNKRMAVQETLQATMSQTLSKISDQLERWGSRPPMQHR